jgi:anthranilate synthase component 1
LIRPRLAGFQLTGDKGATRGPYAGCVGYFGFNGNLDTCITIRTVLFQPKR